MASDETTPEEDMLNSMAGYGAAFHQLRQERHEAGQKEYGEFTFLENDVIRMMAEELADTANYCEMQFVKLMLLNNILVDKLEEAGIKGDEEENIQIGLKAFKGTKDTGWGKPS